MHSTIPANPAVPFQLRHVDPDFIVVDKPSGVVTQPGKGHARDALLNGLFARFGPQLQNMGAARDWGLLHRLDRDTSGLVLVALRPRAYAALRAAFESRTIAKCYWAVVASRPPRQNGTIDLPILEIQGQRKRAVLARRGQPAVTHYRLLASAETTARRSAAPAAVSLVEARPKTGRLHQIRVHLAHLGCPVLGDPEYADGLPMPRVPRLCLHAAELTFAHPATGQRITVVAPCPDDLKAVLMRFGLPIPAG